MLNYRAIAEKLAIENVGLKRQLEGKDVLIKALVEKVYSLEDTIKKMEEEMGTRSSFLSWEILWTEEPGSIQSIGSQIQMQLND